MTDHDFIVNNFYKILDKKSMYYFVIETEFSRHHFEKISHSCKDRGKWKWIAETKLMGCDSPNEEAIRSHVDPHDCFPRFYFLEESLVNEFLQWLDVRQLKITSFIENPTI